MAKDKKGRGVRSGGDGDRSGFVTEPATTPTPIEPEPATTPTPTPTPTPTEPATSFHDGEIISMDSSMVVSYDWGRAYMENTTDQQILDIPSSFGNHGLFGDGMYSGRKKYKRDEMEAWDPTKLKSRLSFYLMRHWISYQPNKLKPNNKLLSHHHGFLKHEYTKRDPEVRMGMRKYFKFTSNLLRRHRLKLNKALNESCSPIFGTVVGLRELKVDVFKKKLARYGLYPSIHIAYGKFKVPGKKGKKMRQVLKAVRLHLSPFDHTVISPPMKRTKGRWEKGNYDDTQPLYVT